MNREHHQLGALEALRTLGAHGLGTIRSDRNGHHWALQGMALRPLLAVLRSRPLPERWGPWLVETREWLDRATPSQPFTAPLEPSLEDPELGGLLASIPIRPVSSQMEYRSRS
jgi:hypothetical protein